MPTPRPLAVSLCLAAAAVAGCGGKTTAQKKLEAPPRYAVLEKRKVPDWLKGSIMEQVELNKVEPYRVSNFGLVVLKKPTGDAVNMPNNVREFMLREMQKRRFGSWNQPGFENLSPETVLRDPRMAVVRVDCFIPPGASPGQRIDAYVTALPDSNTTSLAGGMLYTADLFENGANVLSPGTGIDALANAHGYIFVNPAYALDATPDSATERRALTSGTILNGGRVNQPRPIGLRILSAEARISRMTEQRIALLFGGSVAGGGLATAKDEGQVFVRTPEKYKGDWEHLAGVVLHTFYNASGAFVAAKAKQLAEVAQRPDSADVLLDVSYAIEALGKSAVPHVESLMYHARPDVAYAAARAVAWIGDGAAEAALAAMAKDPNNPFRISAVETLAALPTTPSINMALRDLINAPDALVRIEAYKGLVNNDGSAVFSKPIGDKFFLDIIESSGPPLIYASRTGNARIAFIGSTARLATPAFFTAMNDELSISDDATNKQLLSIFYRGNRGASVQMLSTPDLAEIVARLGGEGMAGQPRFDFSYGEIVALLGKLSDDKRLVSGDRTKPASFVLQSAPGADRAIDNVPVIPEGPRPVDVPAPDAQPSASVR